MNHPIHILTHLLIWSTLLSCTASRSLRLSHRRNEQSQHHTFVQRDSLDDLQVSTRIWDQRQQAEAFIWIKPDGFIRLHPDSGFIGKAEQLLYYRQQRRRSFVQDSTSRHLSRQQLYQQQSKATDIREEMREQRSTKPSTQRYLYVLASIGVLLLIFWIRRKLRGY